MPFGNSLAIAVLKRSLAEVFGSQMAEQWLCYTIYQMVNGGSEDLYKD